MCGNFHFETIKKLLTLLLIPYVEISEIKRN